MYEQVLEHLRDTGLADVGEDISGVGGAASLLAELPATYAAALRIANGFTINQGMNRIFGIRADRHMDLRAWNEPEGWRFAWGERADGFLFFGGTVFGDQYGLRRLTGGGFAYGVYLLDTNELVANIVADTFDEFLAKEVVRNAAMPHSPLARASMQVFGTVKPENHLVVTPSLLLGGVEDTANLVLMESYTAMIYGGDICTAVFAADDEALILGVEPWSDDRGRQRLRVRFG